MKGLVHILWQIWVLTAAMAPSLLIGFAAAGVLSLLITPQMVYRHLGRPGLRQICKAALFGVPLPLCSCSVLPVAASLRRYGAGRGSTVSFLASTPQTGVDSILVTLRLLGPVFAVVRCAAAFVSGIICGCCVELLPPEGAAAPDESAEGCRCACSDSTEAQPAGQGEERGDRVGALRGVLRHAFVTLPRDMGRSMVFGLILAGILTAFLPEDYFAGKLVGSEWLSMLVMLAAGLTVYVCSSGSVPVVLALIAAGISPGAGLVFLIAGPATNTAALVTVTRMLGVRVTAVYLAALSLTALISGFALNRFVTVADVSAAVHCHDEPLSWFSHACAAALLILFIPAFRRVKRAE
jgi:uncharacterized protein